MGLLSDFFIATIDDARRYGDRLEIDDADVLRLRRVGPLEVAALLAILRNVPEGPDLITEFTLLTPEHAEEWTVEVPSDMVERLHALRPADYVKVATDFSAATLEELEWSVDECASMVADLSNLARRATTTRKHMFLWNSL